MISSALAVNLAATLPPERLRSSVFLAILDGRVLQPGIRGDSQPEDLAVAILLGPPGIARDAVVAGCRDVCAALLAVLAQSRPAPTALIAGHELPLDEAVAHFGALLNRSAAPELAAYSKSLLQLVLRPEVDRTLRGPVVRSALAYARSESEAPFWEPLVAGELIPVWAFKALVQIDPRHSRIVKTLGNLWIRCLNGDLKLNAPMLTREVSQKQRTPTEFLTQLRGYVEGALQSPEQSAAFHAEWSKVLEFNKPPAAKPSSLHEARAHVMHASSLTRATMHADSKRTEQLRRIGKAAFIKPPHLPKLHDLGVKPGVPAQQRLTGKMDALIALALAKTNVFIDSGSSAHWILAGIKSVGNLEAFTLNAKVFGQKQERVTNEAAPTRIGNWREEKLSNLGENWRIGVHIPGSTIEAIDGSNFEVARATGALQQSLAVRTKLFNRGFRKKARGALRAFEAKNFALKS